jgi:hypothetical protein
MIFALCTSCKGDFLDTFPFDLLSRAIHRPTTRFNAMNRPTATDFVRTGTTATIEQQLLFTAKTI